MSVWKRLTFIFVCFSIQLINSRKSLSKFYFCLSSLTLSYRCFALVIVNKHRVLPFKVVPMEAQILARIITIFDSIISLLLQTPVIRFFNMHVVQSEVYCLSATIIRYHFKGYLVSIVLPLACTNLFCNKRFATLVDSGWRLTSRSTPFAVPTYFKTFSSPVTNLIVNKPSNHVYFTLVEIVFLLLSNSIKCPRSIFVQILRSFYFQHDRIFNFIFEI